MNVFKLKIACIFILVVMLLQFEKTYSQDFHLSQYDAASLYLNPALTAAYFQEKTDYRVYADYRSQWKAVSGNPYTTSYLAFDMVQKRFGVGGYLINNRAGSGGFNTFNFLLSGSYQIIEGANNPHFLSVGLQAGILNKSFNPDKFLFDSQYSGTSQNGFDENLSSNEVFNKTSLLKFDANMGIYYKYTVKHNTFHPFAGFSLYHITMPNESFTDEKQRLPIRYVLNGGSDIRLNENFKIVPSALFMMQQKARELNVGILGYYHIRDTKYDVLLGINYRIEDAFIIQFGIKQDGHVFRVSYDVNTSYLNQFSGNKGGIEFSLIFSGRRKQPIFQF